MKRLHLVLPGLVVVLSGVLSGGCIEGLTGGPEDGGCSGAGCSCSFDRDCSGDTPLCDQSTGLCVACLPDRDTCPSGQKCLTRAGAYACLTPCDATPDCPPVQGNPLSCCDHICVDKQTDLQNCGACGMACQPPPHATAECVAGTCRLGACGASFADCDRNPSNGCEIATGQDPKNCGSCGTKCAAGPHQSAGCELSRCTTICETGRADCDLIVADGCEALLASDTRNCGGCGLSCPIPAHATPGCLAGKCGIGSCSAGFADCNRNVQDGCESDLMSGLASCGACNVACPAPQNAVPRCRNGACALGSCLPGFADCDQQFNTGCEAATQSDTRNCGACGHVCAGANSVQACSGGACEIRSCGAGFADCDHVVDTGCESNPQVDLANCGGCGRPCAVPPNAMAAGCFNGTCGVGQCKPGFSDCNQMPNDGCEADLTSIENCGACNALCKALPHAAPACTMGACGLGTCNMGFADCNKVPQDGCESEPARDPLNCGGCGVGCPAFVNAAPACTNGACTIGPCLGAWLDCDGNSGTGCEANSDTDAQNCGACRNVCPQGLICKSGSCTCAQCSYPNATSTCANNVCAFGKCVAGYADCNANPNDGCETDSRHDAKSCGGCGIVCPGIKPYCVSGSCVDTTSPFFDSMPVRANGLDRVAGAGCGTLLTASSNATVVGIGVHVKLTVATNLRFLIFTHPGHALVYASSAKSFAPGQSWMFSDPVPPFVLQSGQSYDIGAIADQPATFSYDVSSERMGGLISLVQDPLWSSFANPFVSSHGGVDCGIQLF